MEIDAKAQVTIMQFLQQMLQAPDDSTLIRLRERTMGFIAGIASPVTDENGAFDCSLLTWTVSAPLRSPNGQTDLEAAPIQ